MSDSRSDNELMLAVRGGDLYALGVLYQRHRERVHGLCTRLAGDTATGDDLVQETFLRVLRFRHTFKGEARFTTWLYRIARNVALRHLETSGRRQDREAAAGREAPLATPAAPAEADADRVARLKDAMAALPPDQREVLVLSRYHGLRYYEIADVCECTVDAVKARVYRAMRSLRRAFDATKETSDGQLRAEQR